MRRSMTRLLGLAACVTLAGCGIGYNRMLFFTKTNVGLDIDAQPPTAEVSIARREGVIAPSYEEGKTVPVAATFRKESPTFYDPRISAAFAGGEAAALLSKPLPAANASPSAGAPLRMCLSHKPKASRLLAFWSALPVIGALFEEGDQTRPFFFGTDTSYGLKVVWSGTAGAAPTTVRLGYNRKEFADAPVFGEQETAAATPPAGGAVSAPAAAGTAPCPYAVQVPSFIATIDNSTKLEKFPGSLQYVQFFATGAAADNFAVLPQVRKVLEEQFSPLAAQAAVQERIDDARTITAALSKEAQDLIDAMTTDAQLATATTQARSAGLIGATEGPAAGSDVAAKKTFLKAVANVGDNPERVAALKKFLKALKGE